MIGIPHPELGEEVGAAVALKPGASATPDELRAFVKERVAAYKYPRHVWLVDELPKGPTGKILRREVQPAARTWRDGATAEAGRPIRPRPERAEAAERGRGALDLLLSDAALRRAAPVPAGHVRAAASAAGLARRPRLVGRRGGAADRGVRPGSRPAGRRSRPDRRDRRFADPAWTANPLLKRVMQAYLAAGRTAERAARRRRAGLAGQRADEVPADEPGRRGRAEQQPADQPGRLEGGRSTPAACASSAGAARFVSRPGRAAARPDDGRARTRSRSARTWP